MVEYGVFCRTPGWPQTGQVLEARYLSVALILTILCVYGTEIKSVKAMPALFVTLQFGLTFSKETALEAIYSRGITRSQRQVRHAGFGRLEIGEQNEADATSSTETNPDAGRDFSIGCVRVSQAHDIPHSRNAWLIKPPRRRGGHIDAEGSLLRNPVRRLGR